ncbi:hypothetical protein N1027_11845 [Herbiconiux sp. CPCC 205763]|uniref:Uncharacterized protein n=1 Tax=Herbiconiux aconitum TaxID=2970913 RepID=A0ABT2GRH6_9MICO|nr:hypothetical protein [Herbiconiux aconitum]MCS5718827.1 hypothetical protein [Herbiconiux aconitum]
MRIPTEWLRSWIWLLLIPACAALGVLFSAVAFRSANAIVLSVAVSGALGVCAAALILSHTWRVRSRHDRAAALHPGALVIDVFRDRTATRVLGEVSDGRTGTRAKPMAVAFTSAGAHFYAGSGSAAVASVPWSVVNVCKRGSIPWYSIDPIVGSLGAAGSGSSNRFALVLEMSGSLELALPVERAGYLIARARHITEVLDEIERIAPGKTQTAIRGSRRDARS